MRAKSDAIDTAKAVDMTLVKWSKDFAVGIELIDNQHMELVNLTNQLYRACLTSPTEIEHTFKEVMGRMVEYVRFHFGTEQKLLERIHYPDYNDHKNRHDQLVKDILEAVNNYGKGMKYVPNNFARTLKDWVFEHIAIYDQIYAAYVREQKSKGLLTDLQING